MSIEREYSKFVATCDGCGATLPPQGTYEEAKDAMTEAEWTYNFGTGENLCPDCQED